MSASREKRNRHAGGFLEDSKKKPAKKPEKNSRIYTIIAILLAVVIVGSAGLMVWQLGVAPNMAVASIGGDGVYAHEVNYYYMSSYINYINTYSEYLSSLGLDLSAIGLDTSLSLKAQSPSATEDNPTPGTWHDYFVEQALFSARQVKTFCKLAKQEGMTLNDDSLQHIEEEIQSLTEYVASDTDVTVKEYLSQYYGARMTEAEYKRVISDGYLAQQYAAAKGESFEYTTDELAAFYDEHSKDYDIATFRAYYVSGTAETTDEMTDEEKTAANEAAMLKAVEEAEGIADAADEQAFIRNVAATYAGPAEGATEEEAASTDEFNLSSADSSTLVPGYTNEYVSYYMGEEIAEWVFDSARVSGDTTTIEVSGGVYALCFRERVKEDYNTINVRHILFTFENDMPAEDVAAAEEASETLTPTDEQKAATLARAEEVLALYEAGDKTEDAFAALATEHTEDPGSAETGGLYERVYKGQMVENFEVWCFGSARQYGDVEIVETSYGYHIMYFVGQDLPRWEVQADGGKRNEDYSTWQAEIVQDIVIKQNSGVSAVGLPGDR